MKNQKARKYVKKETQKKGKGVRKKTSAPKYRIAKLTGTFRSEIAKNVIDLAREKKLGINRALHRAQHTDSFQEDVSNYMKAHKIGKTEAWSRVATTCLKAMQKRRDASK